jgi:hypothetical protein
MRLFPLIVVVLLCFSCTDKKSSDDKTKNLSADTTLHIDTTLKKGGSNVTSDTFVLHPSGFKDISSFYDTTVNGIKLNDCDTIEELFGDNYKLLPDIDDLPSIQILNNEQSQLLTMYMWNGSSKCDFSQFQVEYVPSKIEYLQKPFNLKTGNFKSGKGIYLGMTSSQLKTKFGKPSEIRHESGLLIYSYQEYNNLYFGDYYFKKDKLVKFRYGNEYP